MPPGQIRISRWLPVLELFPLKPSNPASRSPQGGGVPLRPKSFMRMLGPRDRPRWCPLLPCSTSQNVTDRSRAPSNRHAERRPDLVHLGFFPRPAGRPRLEVAESADSVLHRRAGPGSPRAGPAGRNRRTGLERATAGPSSGGHRLGPRRTERGSADEVRGEAALRPGFPIASWKGAGTPDLEGAAQPGAVRAKCLVIRFLGRRARYGVTWGCWRHNPFRAAPGLAHPGPRPRPCPRPPLGRIGWH